MVELFERGREPREAPSRARDRPKAPRPWESWSLNPSAALRGRPVFRLDSHRSRKQGAVLGPSDAIAYKADELRSKAHG